MGVPRREWSTNALMVNLMVYQMQASEAASLECGRAVHSREIMQKPCPGSSSASLPACAPARWRRPIEPDDPAGRRRPEAYRIAVTPHVGRGDASTAASRSTCRCAAAPIASCWTAPTWPSRARPSTAEPAAAADRARRRTPARHVHVRAPARAGPPHAADRLQRQDQRPGRGPVPAEARDARGRRRPRCSRCSRTPTRAASCRAGTSPRAAPPST